MTFYKKMHTMINELKDFFEAIAFATNATTLIVNFKSFKFRFPIYSVKTALNETSDIEKIIDTLFYRKQVAWEHSNYENYDWCIGSLKDLRDKCDDASDDFRRRGQTDDKYHFLSTLLRTYGSYADEAYKDLVKSDLTGRNLDSVLKSFRKKIYPIITTLLFALPDGNVSKDNGFEKLELGTKNSTLKMKQILPQWTIEQK